MKRSVMTLAAVFGLAAAAAGGFAGRPCIERWLAPRPEVHAGLCEAVIRLQLRAPATYRTISAAGYTVHGQYKTVIQFDAENGAGVPLRNWAFCTFEGTSASGLPRLRAAQIEGTVIGARQIPTVRSLAESAWSGR